LWKLTQVEIPFGRAVLLQFAAHPLDLALADLVRQRLARPDDVPIDFVNSFALAIVGELTQRLVSRQRRLLLRAQLRA
jgi:hypothetical protein